MNFGLLASFALGPIGTAIVSLVTVPTIAWFFTPEDVGRIAMLQVGISFSLLVFSLGLDQAYVREYHGHRNSVGLFKACLIPGLTLLSLALLIQIFLPNTLGRLLFGESAPLLSGLATVCILAAFITRFLSLILRMQERGLAFSLSQLLPKVGLLLVIGIIVLITDTHDLQQLLSAHTATIIATTLVLAWNTRHEWSTQSASLSREQRQELLRFGLPLVLGGLAFWGMTSFDRIFLRNFSSFEALGLYSVCTSFAGAAIILQSIFSTLWAPAAYKLHTAGAAPATIQRATDHVLAAVVFLFTIAGLLSWILAFLLPVRYQDSQHIVLACLAYPLLYTLGEASGIGLGIKRKSGIAMLSTIAALCANIALNAALVPLYGAAGAASATALSFFSLLVLRTEFNSRYWAPTPRIRLYAFAGGCTALAVAHALAGPHYPTTFILLWGVMFIAALICFRGNLLMLANWLRTAREAKTSN
ncbi:lipopolysaccharide biosynthesis protein [Brachymonas denitrificans]|uniref:lipopolysaccharide biosynthesis protein n=1 Tax=Brachymonas denitrificans TaxID=28220 RepID=UPI00321F72A7